MSRRGRGRRSGVPTPDASAAREMRSTRSRSRQPESPMPSPIPAPVRLPTPRQRKSTPAPAQDSAGSDDEEQDARAAAVTSLSLGNLERMKTVLLWVMAVAGILLLLDVMLLRERRSASAGALRESLDVCEAKLAVYDAHQAQLDVNTHINTLRHDFERCKIELQELQHTALQAGKCACEDAKREGAAAEGKPCEVCEAKDQEIKRCRQDIKNCEQEQRMMQAEHESTQKDVKASLEECALLKRVAEELAQQK